MIIDEHKQNINSAFEMAIEDSKIALSCTETIGAMEAEPHPKILQGIKSFEALANRIDQLEAFVAKLRDDPQAKAADGMSITLALNDKDVKLAVRLAVEDTKYQIAQEAALLLRDNQPDTRHTEG